MKDSSKHIVAGILFFIGGIIVSVSWLSILIHYQFDDTHWVWGYQITSIVEMLAYGMVGVAVLLIYLPLLGLQIKRIKITSN